MNKALQHVSPWTSECTTKMPSTGGGGLFDVMGYPENLMVHHDFPIWVLIFFKMGDPQVTMGFSAPRPGFIIWMIWATSILGNLHMFSSR